MKTGKIYIFLLVLSGWMIQSCTDGFEELNTDPKNPTVANSAALFNQIISKINPSSAVGGIHHSRYDFQTQLLGNAKATYNLISTSSSTWDEYYYLVKNVRLLYDKLHEISPTQNIAHAKACLDILYAFKSLEMADYFGDFPFSDGGKGVYGSQYYEAAYDKHQDVYKQCMNLLKEANQALNPGAANQYSYGGGDTFLKGDIGRWKKFATALMFRYAMQLVDADASYASFISDILGNPGQYPLLADTENIGLWPRELSNQYFDYHFIWANETPLCMGSAMWRQMSDNDNTDGSGIFDPRTYVFYETNKDKEWKAQKQNPATDDPDQQGVKGPYSGDSYPNGRNKGQTAEEYYNKGDACLFSPVNFYLVCNGDFIPDLFATAAEMNLLKAEAYNRGIGVSKNPTAAKAAYEAGINSSIAFWYREIAEKHPGWIFDKPVWNPAMNSNYLLHEAYANDEAAALKQIHKQLWIDYFRQPAAAFNLYRRTLNTPRDVSGNYNPGDYNFYTCPYPESERNYNSVNFNKATNNGANNEYFNKKLFWHK